MRSTETIKTKILKTAQQILGLRGYSAFSIQLLAEKTGLGTEFYSNPLSKKSILFHTLVTEFYQQAADRVAAAFRPALSPKETLHHYIASYLKYINENHTGARAVFEIMKNYRDPDGNSIYEPQKLTLYQPLTDILKDCPNLLFPAPMMAQLVHCVTDTIAIELMNDRLDNTDQVIERSSAVFDFITKRPK